MKSENLEDFLNEELLGVKPSKKKKKIEWEESDPKEILGEAGEDSNTPDTNLNKKKKNKKSSESEEETDVGDDEDTRTSDDTSNEPKPDSDEDEEFRIKPEKPNHQPQGKKVMEVSLSLSDTDFGEVEIGDEEYASVTNLSSLLSFYEIDTQKLKDPKTMTETLKLSVKEVISQIGNSISIMMQLNTDDTISINVLVNELGQTFQDIAAAINYFDSQYQNNILNIINKEVRA